MDRVNQAYQTFFSYGNALLGWVSGTVSAVSLSVKAITSKADSHSGHKEGSSLSDRTICPLYDCRPKAAEEAGYTYDFLLNLCMPRDHRPLPNEIVEKITGQNIWYRKTLAEGLEYALKKAEENASLGDKSTMDRYIGKAKSIAEKLDVNISTLIPTINLQKHLDYMHKQIEVHLSDSRLYANQGKREMMHTAFEIAHSMASQSGITIYETIPMLNVQKEPKYLCGELDKYLKEASECANNGDNSGMEYCIHKAQEIAKSLNIDIGHRIPTLNEANVSVYLRQRLEKRLKRAMECAHTGEKEDMEFAQSWAKEIAVKLDIDISERVDEIAITFHRKFGITARL